MRFVLAILAFAAAAVMIGFGIAQRTVFLEPDRISLGTVVEDQADYIVLEPEALAAQSGKQTITVSGSETVFLAYGRTDDVEAWIGDDSYVSVGYDADAGEFTNEVVAGQSAEGETPETTEPEATPAPDAEGAEETAEPAASPAGSDLWLDELTGDRTLTTTIDVPEGISVLLASDGTEPAPGRIVVAWPLDNSTPWAGPLIAGGGLVFLVGIALVISGVLAHRRSRGPRRNLPKGPKGKLTRAPRPTRSQRAAASGAGPRRTSGRARRVALLPVLLVPAIALSACSSDYWPDFAATPETSAPATPAATDQPADDTAAEGEAEVVPAVTVPQMERIMRSVAVFTTEVDESRDVQRLTERFAGPAFQARKANYVIRGSVTDHPALPAIPAAPLTLTLPQQATGWPRTVLTIAKNSDDETVAPTALVMRQESPRENYKVVYATALVPDADVPEVAPASIGAPPISPEFKGLVMPTGQVAAAYADVLLKGPESEFAEFFDPEGDVVLQQLGVEGQKATAESLPDTADIAFSNVVGDSPTVALATNDSGALVTVSINQTEKVTPNDGGTVGFEPGPGRALSGFDDKSAKGVQRVVGIQLMFYVPAVGADEQIRLLGWSESLIGASEVP
ncbi:hypothetical protein BCL57_001959 [Agromyces flavus]|uniref:DUF8094 domain-containing protein n=1 Tax=Agromyces flavus TaxID=589382 RepID=A0A1H1Q6N9_9MICO|nr:hypothetical protein [Agromyces flavus]MCP2367800.1 hypothetical protein [Agromyces flavus]GGI47260.1 hypothetical protein GCM10010932_19480 [Agromyces flavus]SDS18649.1 hypothetical protein SAMN04489721_0906 [Agromyces flavus]